MTAISNIFTRLQRLGDVLTEHGTHMALSLAVLIAGMLVVRGIHKGLIKLMTKNRFGVVLCNTVYIVLTIVQS